MSPNVSEPDGFYARLSIGRAAFAEFLNSPVARASDWDDWAIIGGEWTAFSWAVDGVNLARRIDAETAQLTNRRRLVGLLGAGSTFDYDDDAGRLIIANVMWAENLAEVLRLLALFRGVVPFLGSDDELGLVVRDYLWNAQGAADATAALLATADGSWLLTTANEPDELTILVGESVRYFDHHFASAALSASSDQADELVLRFRA